MKKDKRLPGASYRQVSFDQKLEMMRLIEENATISASDRHVQYNDGWSDQRVATEMDDLWVDYPGDRLDAVRQFRNQRYGSVRRLTANGYVKPPKTEAGLSPLQLAAVQRLIAELRQDMEMRMAKLESRLNYLGVAAPQPALALSGGARR